MEAGAAGPQDTTQAAPVDATPTGNGILVIAGQLEARCIARCFHLPGDTTLSAEGGELVGEREVDDNELVGFDGLIAGDKYIVAAHSRGRYEEIRCSAVDPDVGLTLIQQPIQASPNTLGTQGTHVVDSPAAESEGASDLQSGLPEGVTSPVLGGDSPSQGDPTAAEDAQISPGDISGAEVIAPGVAPVTPEEASQTVDEHLQAEADALKAQQEAEAASAKAAEEAKAADEAAAAATAAADEQKAITEREEAEAAQAKADGEAKAAQEQAEASAKAAEEAEAAAKAKADEEAAAKQAEEDAAAKAAQEAAPADPAPVEPAPAAGEQTVPQAPATEPVTTEAGGVTVQTTTTATPSASGDTSAEAPAPAADAPAPPTQALVDQANSLGIENAATLSDDELRQAITEKQATPVV